MNRKGGPAKAAHLSSVERRCGNAEAEVVLSVALKRVRPMGGPAVIRDDLPASTSTNAGGALNGAARIDGRRHIVRPVVVRHPFPNISLHIVELPVIGLQGTS